MRRRTLALFLVCCTLVCRPLPAAEPQPVTIEIVDRAGAPLPARVYVQSLDDRSWHYVRPAGDEGTAFRYEKQNWNNRDAVEYHTTVSAGPCIADLPDGRYWLTVERGKEYFPEVREIEVAGEPVELQVPLRRMIDMAARGWYSGETHLHRTLEETRNVVLAEDLNVAFPLSYWVTHAGQPPTAGDKNLGGDIPDQLITVDDTHVIWPRNTEYEIFTVGEKRHTLGALFLLNHRSVFDKGVPPWGPVIRQARSEGALFDMDKLDWPFSMMLPVAAEGSLYELANNHVWRTEFGFRNWNTATPSWLQPPWGARQGNEREWLHYTLGMYYTLLNTGMTMSPTAGTANGVHPVPAGFSRVYVHLPDGFDYDRWLAGLKEGRSFVTTGPMLFATVGGRDPGTTFEFDDAGNPLELRMEVISQQPITFCELVRNGIPVRTYRVQNKRQEDGGYRSEETDTFSVHESGWFAVRVWENHDDGRYRFAHSAPWYVSVAGEPVRPRREEKDYLVRRVIDEIERSRDALSDEALIEYERALDVYENLEPQDDSAAVQANARRPESEEALAYWLDNMVRHHRFSIEEVHQATGMDHAAIEAAIERLGLKDAPLPEIAQDRIRVLPYPGGRHPRSGFLDGAILPQRDTKVSVFLPWENSGYVVVDTPEAIFTNLGLTYLAHRHVPTIWTDEGVALPPMEWVHNDDGSFEHERTLPNGIRFGSRVVPQERSVAMELWLHNGTKQPLTGMRVQTCVMLKGAIGFSDQSNHNKRLVSPFAAVHSEDGRRWIITAWEPNHRTWANPPVPCLHSDPILPDCAPGETVRARGRVWFYEGDDIDGELERLRGSLEG
ncbi:CehA/McbA family metallohydrolase [Maioricimonas sp. JC845]|uniref:CehA/McbA family metallohydrolase n=1 Tax=Maioricimonas sp. JC845 TaxID=3232138 RepID=UPI00345A11B1